MGGEGFLEKLKALFGGGGAPAEEPMPPGMKPWEQPLSGMPVGVMPAAPSAMPMAMPPESIADDPMAQAVELARKRRMVQKMIPDFVNR